MEDKTFDKILRGAKEALAEESVNEFPERCDGYCECRAGELLRQEVQRLRVEITRLRADIPLLVKSLSSRVKVENELWAVHANKQALPDREQCKEWAQRLGIPADIRKKYIPQIAEKEVSIEDNLYT